MAKKKVKRDTTGIEPFKFQPGQSGNPNGRPKGSRNRSTIAKEVLDAATTIPDEIFEEIKKRFPGIEKKLSVEHVMTIVMTQKVINEKDVQAYRALIDAAHGTQSNVDMNHTEQPLFPDNDV